MSHEIKYCPQCELYLYSNEFTRTSYMTSSGSTTKRRKRCKVCTKNPLPPHKAVPPHEDEESCYATSSGEAVSSVEVKTFKVPKEVYKAIKENELLKSMHNNRLQEERSREQEKERLKIWIKSESEFQIKRPTREQNKTCYKYAMKHYNKMKNKHRDSILEKQNRLTELENYPKPPEIAITNWKENFEQIRRNDIIINNYKKDTLSFTFPNTFGYITCLKEYSNNFLLKLGVRLYITHEEEIKTINVIRNFFQTISAATTCNETTTITITKVNTFFRECVINHERKYYFGFGHLGDQQSRAEGDSTTSNTATTPTYDPRTYDKFIKDLTKLLKATPSCKTVSSFGSDEQYKFFVKYFFPLKHRKANLYTSKIWQIITERDYNLNLIPREYAINLFKQYLTFCYDERQSFRMTNKYKFFYFTQWLFAMQNKSSLKINKNIFLHLENGLPLSSSFTRKEKESLYNFYLKFYT